MYFGIWFCGLRMQQKSDSDSLIVKIFIIILNFLSQMSLVPYIYCSPHVSGLVIYPISVPILSSLVNAYRSQYLYYMLRSRLLSHQPLPTCHIISALHHVTTLIFHMHMSTPHIIFSMKSLQHDKPMLWQKG